MSEPMTTSHTNSAVVVGELSDERLTNESINEALAILANRRWALRVGGVTNMISTADVTMVEPGWLKAILTELQRRRTPSLADGAEAVEPAALVWPNSTVADVLKLPASLARKDMGGMIPLYTSPTPAERVSYEVTEEMVERAQLVLLGQAPTTKAVREALLAALSSEQGNG